MPPRAASESHSGVRHEKGLRQHAGFPRRLGLVYVRRRSLAGSTLWMIRNRQTSTFATIGAPPHNRRRVDGTTSPRSSRWTMSTSLPRAHVAGQTFADRRPQGRPRDIAHVLNALGRGARNYVDLQCKKPHHCTHRRTPKDGVQQLYFTTSSNINERPRRARPGSTSLADFGADWRSFGTCCPTLRVSRRRSHARLASGWPARPLPGGTRTHRTAARGFSSCSRPSLSCFPDASAMCRAYCAYGLMDQRCIEQRNLSGDASVGSLRNSS